MSNSKAVPERGTAKKIVAGITNAQRRADSVKLLELMGSTTGTEPAVWGSSIIGFGTHHYKYENGREGDTVAVGFAPRSDALALYGLGQDGLNAELAPALGTHTEGKGCLYVKRLDDVDLDVLKKMVKKSFAARHNVKP